MDIKVGYTKEDENEVFETSINNLNNIVQLLKINQNNELISQIQEKVVMLNLQA